MQELAVDHWLPSGYFSDNTITALLPLICRQVPADPICRRTESSLRLITMRASIPSSVSTS